MSEEVYVEGVGIGRVLEITKEIADPEEFEAVVNGTEARMTGDAGGAPRTPPWRTPAARARRAHLRRRRAARQARKNNR